MRKPMKTSVLFISIQRGFLTEFSSLGEPGHSTDLAVDLPGPEYLKLSKSHRNPSPEPEPGSFTGAEGEEEEEGVRGGHHGWTWS